jgi:hypothetical protein
MQNEVRKSAGRKKCQGTTSVVPQIQQIKSGFTVYRKTHSVGMPGIHPRHKANQTPWALAPEVKPAP